MNLVDIFSSARPDARARALCAAAMTFAADPSPVRAAEPPALPSRPIAPEVSREVGPWLVGGQITTTGVAVPG